MRWALVLLVLGATGGQADRPALFESDLWPGERLFPERLAISCDVGLREEPSDRAKARPGAAARRGQTLAFSQTRYVTIEAGAFEALLAASIHGRVLGAIRSLSRDAYNGGQYTWTDIPVESGSVFEYLQYRAEGTCLVRVRDEVIDADVCPLYAKGFRLVREPVAEKWASVTVGKVTGWIKVDDTCVKTVESRK